MEFFTFSFLIGLSLFLFGLLIGFISPTFGVGGGILAVPILILVYNIDVVAATATSIGVVLFTTMSGTIAYIREKRIDYRIAFYFSIFAVPGSIIGSLIAQLFAKESIDKKYLQIIFAATLTLIAFYNIIKLLLKNQKTEKNKYDVDEDLRACEDENLNVSFWKQKRVPRNFCDKRGTVFKYTVKFFPGALLGFLGGIMGSLLGLGGGVIFVPVLSVLMGIPAAIAVATSTFTILLITPVAVTLRFSSILWDYVLCLALGSMLSSTIVPRFIGKVKSEYILTGFWILVILTATRIFLNVIFGVNI